ncbi:DDT domain-containing protein [Artemisia annua]|uniref:DDT domain-containing protein n=1 Tax=Artemisia annua TaxID=35608 RepID=A0A2U1Q017_ARTAN|nr:DDT domain-containing protein [Artemisia annua]
MSKKKQARGKKQQQINRTKCVAAKSNVSKKRNNNKKLGLRKIQDDLLPADYIITKVLRKDGPPLGVEFDTLPEHAFRFCNHKVSKKSHRVCQEKQRAFKRQKTSKPTIIENQITPRDSASVKHGVGKGLMAVRRLTNQPRDTVRSHGIGKGFMAMQRLTQLGGVNLPTCVENDHGAGSRVPPSTSKKPPAQVKKKPRRKQPVKRRVVNKVQEKKSSARSKKVRCEQVDKEKQQRSGVCEIALVGGRSEEDPSQYAMLVDDEELELKELQETSNHAISCEHCAANGLHGCSLCKDLLAKFPPSSVRMKQPLHMQPWDSSPHLVKKLFKIYHFICTYAVIIRTQSFTLDELAQAFIDKDSLLLGKLNISLLKLLLTGVEKELDIEYVSHISKNWKYRALIQSIEREDSVLKFWKKSLNPLTWIEILRQVLVAAGFGSKRDMSLKEPPNKEAALMARYGLRPGTLKGELFTILLSQGNAGMKISELATSSSIVGLKLATTTDKVEELISSMLSSDITLFEKISFASYRLRSNSIIKDAEDDQSDLEDCGSVDDDPNDISNSHNIDDSDDCSGALIAHKHGQTNSNKSKDNTLTIHSEIDESHPGEMWLLGLIEGEYSDLNIDEKLNALLALVDLLKAGSSIQMEERVSSAVQCVPNIYQIGSGAKIKRSTAKQQRIFVPLENNCRQIINSGESDTMPDVQPVDSSAVISVVQEESMEKDVTEVEDVDDLHPMQSIYLGSDRRYNRYWLFLGPCNTFDPGHKRIYFESSEDDHWDVIETQEALTSLLSVLDRRGRRECHLLSSLEKREAFLCEAMSSIHNDVRVGQPTISGDSERSISRDDSSSAVSDVDNLLGLNYMHHDNLASTSDVIAPIGNREQAKQKWRRLQQFDYWVWSSFRSALGSIKHGKKSFLDSFARCERCHDLFWRDEKHCRICHTTFELDFDIEERYAIHFATCRDDSDPDMFPKHKILSSQLQSLKAAAYTLELSMPEGSMVGAWTKSVHNVWVRRLRRTSTLPELLQVLGDFVGAINNGWSYESDTALGFDCDLDDIIASFASMPQTSSAVALWLVKLDFIVTPHLKRVDLETTTGASTRTRSKGKQTLVSRYLM